MRSSTTAWLLAALALSWSAAEAAEVKVEPYGATQDGRKVTAYTLVNDKGNSATILDYGATISAVRVPDRKGQRTNVVMAFADVAGWESMGHANAILGRVTNRLLNGFTLDGVHYPLKPNANGVTMHSATGYTGYSVRIWGVEPVRPQDGAAVTMTLDSPDGDQGFPGNLKIRATYRFDNDDQLRLDMSAATDKPTVINLTNHVYFNLNGNGSVPVFDHELQVMSDKIAEQGPQTEYTGKILPVAGTPWDFTKPTPVRERLALALGAEYAAAATAPPVPPTMIRSFNLPYFATAWTGSLPACAIRRAAGCWRCAPPNPRCTFIRRPRCGAISSAIRASPSRACRRSPSRPSTCPRRPITPSSPRSCCGRGRPGGRPPSSPSRPTPAARRRRSQRPQASLDWA